MNNRGPRPEQIKHNKPLKSEQGKKHFFKKRINRKKYPLSTKELIVENKLVHLYYQNDLLSFQISGLGYKKIAPKTL